jgi:hypothetical protein
MKRILLVCILMWLGGCVGGCATVLHTKAPPVVGPTLVIMHTAAPPPLPAPPPTPAPKPTVVTVVETKPVVCNFVPPTQQAPLPSAPTTSKAETVTDHQRAALMQAYIWQLLNYINREHATEAATYANFANACLKPAGPG